MGLLRSRNRWPSEPQQIIRDNYETKTAKQIVAPPAMAATGKTVNSVEKQRTHQGLKK